VLLSVRQTVHHKTIRQHVALAREMSDRRDGLAPIFAVWLVGRTGTGTSVAIAVVVAALVPSAEASERIPTAPAAALVWETYSDQVADLAATRRTASHSRFRAIWWRFPWAGLWRLGRCEYGQELTRKELN
jgi:hypothetical protein